MPLWHVSRTGIVAQGGAGSPPREVWLRAESLHEDSAALVDERGGVVYGRGGVDQCRSCRLIVTPLPAGWDGECRRCKRYVGRSVADVLRASPHAPPSSG